MVIGISRVTGAESSRRVCGGFLLHQLCFVCNLLLMAPMASLRLRNIHGACGVARIDFSSRRGQRLEVFWIQTLRLIAGRQCGGT